MPKQPYIEQPAAEKLVQELIIATDASVGIIGIRCAETEVYRVVDEIYAQAQAGKQEFRVHTSETGWSQYDTVDPDDTRATPFNALTPKASDKATSEPMKAFQNLSDPATPLDGFFVMLDLFYSFGIQATQTSIRKQAQRALNNGQRLFIIIPNHAEIPDAIAPLMHIIHFGFPTGEELSQSLDDILSSIEEAERPQLTEDERNLIIANGKGMTAHSFETAIALSITEFGERNEITVQAGEETITQGSLEGFGSVDIVKMIRQYKVQALRKTNVLELQPNVPLEDIGGLESFKEWMVQRRATYQPEAREHLITPSRGALVVGPPGTGKSVMAKAAGSILGLSVIRFDVGRVFGAYIGQSEQAMRNVLSIIDAMAPCVLMLDEIDKGFSGMLGGGESNSGTTQRVFGTFLTWMQERDQLNRPVFMIMTANRVEGLPPELLRKGRVDEVWAVNVPNEHERAQILTIHCRKRDQKIAKGDIPSIVRLTDGLVGSEIEALIEDTLVMSYAAGKALIDHDGIEAAMKFLKPMSKTRAAEFESMKLWAEKNARPSSLVAAPKEAVKPTSPIVRRGKTRTRATIKRSS